MNDWTVDLKQVEEAAGDISSALDWIKISLEERDARIDSLENQVSDLEVRVLELKEGQEA